MGIRMGLTGSVLMGIVMVGRGIIMAIVTVTVMEILPTTSPALTATVTAVTLAAETTTKLAGIGNLK